MTGRARRRIKRCLLQRSLHCRTRAACTASLIFAGALRVLLGHRARIHRTRRHQRLAQPLGLRIGLPRKPSRPRASAIAGLQGFRKARGLAQRVAALEQGAPAPPAPTPSRDGYSHARARRAAPDRGIRSAPAAARTTASANRRCDLRGRYGAAGCRRAWSPCRDHA